MFWSVRNAAVVTTLILGLAIADSAAGASTYTWNGPNSGGYWTNGIWFQRPANLSGGTSGISTSGSGYLSTSGGISGSARSRARPPAGRAMYSNGPLGPNI